MWALGKLRAQHLAPSYRKNAWRSFQGVVTGETPEEPRVPPVAPPLVANLPEDITFEPYQDVPLPPRPSIPFPRLLPVSKTLDPAKARIDPIGLRAAVQLVKVSASAKFDETVEVHIRLGIDPRRGDQMVRGAAPLPHGTGKAVRVAVFADGAAAEEARAAGADTVGAEDLIQSVKASGGKLDFDKCIATPAMMPKLAAIARVLGPRGLMPNPKLGTVTAQVAQAILAAKRGRVDFRADKTGIVHAGVGKVSFEGNKLEENVVALLAALLSAKPVGLKKMSPIGYFKGVTLASTMGPGVPLALPPLIQAANELMQAQV